MAIGGAFRCERFMAAALRGLVAAALLIGVAIHWPDSALAQQTAASLSGDPSRLASAQDLSPIEARNALARANYLPNLNGFQTAVETGDLKAIPLYQASGFELSGSTLRTYVIPLYGNADHFDPATAKALLKGGVNKQDFCLDPSGSWDQYSVTGRGLAHETDRRAFLRALCGDASTVLAVSALLRAEELKLAALTLENEARPDILADCVDAYMADHPMIETMDEAEQFSLFTVARMTPPHDTVMMELSSWHLSGQKTDAEEAYAQAVANGCDAAIPAHVINTVHADRLRSVLTLLQPQAPETTP
ncbi:MAG: hypothetical protein AAGJ32_08240 [Pseudomonadota bacterium]